MQEIHAVWGESPDGELMPVMLGSRAEVRVGSPLMTRDPISGAKRVDEDWQGPGRVHGRAYDNRADMQTPLPMGVAGGDAYGPMAKYPATMGNGGDCVGQVTRYQRYPAIAHIRPESTGTIGSVARQSYQYVREQMPDKRPRNAWDPLANPPGVDLRSIDSTVPPALEPPRYNYAGLDTDYLQQQDDILTSRALMAERGMSG